MRIVKHDAKNHDVQRTLLIVRTDGTFEGTANSGGADTSGAKKSDGAEKKMLLVQDLVLK